MLLVGRPCRTGDEGRTRRAQSLNDRGCGALRARPDLIEPRIASDANPVGSHTLLAQPFGVLVIDGANAIVALSTRPQREPGEELDAALGLAPDEGVLVELCLPAAAPGR